MSEKKLSGLFINCLEAQCSIYESGKMAFQCLKDSDKYSFDYIEIDSDNRSIPTNYDFYFFNYHITTMSWLNTKSLKKSLPGLKMTMVLEVAPNNPFVHFSPGDFDAYCVLDPTLNVKQANVFAFPRPLEFIDNLAPHEPKQVPVIGSFGFATKGKGFEHLIDAVNKEFDEAIVKINIPFATHADESQEYAKYLAQMCKGKAKSGIQVIVTHEFMSKSDLIEWCRQNTINCFLYDRNMYGLAATTDQAVSSGRPLCISKNNTFRHIQKYIKPFPYQTLREAIETTQADVEKIQKEWSPAEFRKRFEEVLGNFKFESDSKGQAAVNLMIKKPSIYKRIFGKIKRLSKIRSLIDTSQPSFRENSVKDKNKLEQKNSYSQFGEDTIVADLLADFGIQNISYLDIGANNPKYISNTYLFYERGSTGVLVEPNALLCKKLKAVRPQDVVLNVGIGMDDDVTEADFYLFPEEADGLSTFSLKEAKHWEEVGMGGIKFKVEKVVKMPIVNINDIIANNFTECPDFISIDVEGWDLKILKTLNFEKYSPAVFCVETLAYKEDGSTYRIQEIHDLFENKGYFSFKETIANNIFVNKNLYDFYIYQKSQNNRTE